MADILKKMAEEEPELEEIATAFTQLDPDVIRVMAVNRDNKYITNGFSTNLSVTAIEDKLMASMPLDFVTGAMEESLKQEGAELISSENLAAKNPNGVEVADFDFVQSTFSATGNKVQVRSRIVIFQAGGKLILIQLATPKQFGEELLPVLDHIKDTIKLLEL